MSPILEKTNSENTNFECNNYISWNAIIIPALLAVGLSFLVNMFTAGLGLSAYTTSSAGQTTLMVSGFILLFLLFYIIMFFIGYIAGFMTQPFRCAGILHAFAAWCLALIINVALFSPSAANAFGTPTYYSYKAVATNQTISQPKNNQPLSEDATNKLGIGILGLFFIFLAGALGSATGGYVGSRSNNNTTIRRDRAL